MDFLFDLAESHVQDIFVTFPGAVQEMKPYINFIDSTFREFPLVI